jgi:AraC-like DNA-binding protein
MPAVDRPSTVWRAEFTPGAQLNGFPFPRVVQRQVVTDQRYHLRGASRLHEDYCVAKFTLSGAGVFFDGRAHRVGPGSAFLCEIGDPGTEYCYPPEAVEPWEFVFVAFYGARDKVRALGDQFGRVYRVGPSSGIVRRLLRYGRGGSKNVRASSVEGAALVTDVLLALAASAMPAAEKRAGARLAERMRSYVTSHVDREFGVSDLAAELSVTVEHLCRSFRRETGLTPLQFLNRTRVRAACELLKLTDLSIKEIAARVGLGGGHFNRTFKRLLGTTPGEFRESGVVPLF